MKTKNTSHIDAGNILIAELVGDEIIIEHDKIIIISENGVWVSTATTECYHSSWDWLMCAVKECKKIHSLGYKGSNIEMQLKTLNIRKVWKAVIEFIEWYNKIC